jgi:hypothetical protein
MRNIKEMLDEAEAQMQEAAASTMIARFYSDSRNSELTSLKEEWTLGSFAIRFNEYYTPELVWARHNAKKTKRADFSVYGADLSFLCDIEVTGLWSTPKIKNPQKYEDFSPYPIWLDEHNPDLMHVDIDKPPTLQPYGRLERIIATHLRHDYPAYWLVIWDNDHAVRHPNFDELAERVREILEGKCKVRARSTNLQQVWLFDENSARPQQVLFSK